MKKLLFILTIFVLTSSVKAQKSEYLYTFYLTNPVIVKVEDNDLKEKAYVKYDSTTDGWVKRGDQKLIYYGFWREVAIEKEIADASCAVALQLNQDGSVIDIDKLRQALIRWADVKAKYFAYMPIECQ